MLVSDERGGTRRGVDDEGRPGTGPGIEDGRLAGTEAGERATGSSGGGRRAALLVVVLVLAGAVAYTTGLPFGVVCSSPPPPDFGFQASHADGAVTLTVVYEGGPVLEAGRLRLVTADRNRTWASLAPDLGPGATVRAGDRIRLDGLAPGTPVRVGMVRRDDDTDDLDECWDPRYRFEAFDAYEVGRDRTET